MGPEEFPRNYLGQEFEEHEQIFDFGSVGAGFEQSKFTHSGSKG